MPTYDYFCEKCGKTFEASQSMRDARFRECPKELCRQKKWGHGSVRRLLGTGAGLLFKGSGFYITDYRSNNYKEGAKKESARSAPVSADKSPGSKESAGTATPPAAPKAEAKPKKQTAND